MKKEVSGIFKSCYYNDCEAACPIGISIEGKDYTENLCDILKEILGIEDNLSDDEKYPTHKFINKKVKFIIEIDEK